MEEILKEIIAVSGKSGLFKIISSKSKVLIAESLTDKKRIPIHATGKISSLGEISVYTEEGDLTLEEIFRKMNQFLKEKNAPVGKADNNVDIQNFFAEIVPTYDKKRVYVSDMRKILRWYNILLEKKLLKFEEKEETENTASSKEV